ncbi:MAG TPA: hypothetical protein V6D17_12165 [Candidatus Obscuribacterales bacterium]
MGMLAALSIALTRPWLRNGKSGLTGAGGWNLLHATVKGVKLTDEDCYSDPPDKSSVFLLRKKRMY